MSEHKPINSATFESPALTQSVLNRLQEIDHNTIAPLLDAKRALDPQAGIIIVPLPDAGSVAGDEGLPYKFYGARILTGEQNFVNPHYHKIGQEPYHVLAGERGEMNIGVMQDGAIAWKAPTRVSAGDSIEVREGEVHSLRNLGVTPLDFTFASPDGHLVDNSPDHPDGDRYLTRDLPNGIPPQYLKVAHE